MDRDAYLKEELCRLESEGNLRHLTPAGHEGSHVIAEGRKMLNLSSNDYLGLAADVSLRREFMERLDPGDFVMSSSSSRSLSGEFPVYGQVEDKLSEMFGKEAALVFNSGYHMNLGILPAVAGKDTLVVADKLVHASMIDGIRLSAAGAIRFRHNDMTQLGNILEKEHGRHRRIIIAAESVYSMDGDRADLRMLCEFKKRYDNVFLYVDEAHAFGVFGENGLGLAEEQGCIRDIDYLCGTFGKALASMGGFVVCSRTVREYLINRMRPFIFSTALPPVNWRWTEFLLGKLSGMKDRREHLAMLSDRLRSGLEDLGFVMVSDTQIVPLTAGESKVAVRLASELQAAGFFVLPVRPPTVPEGSSRLRFSLTAEMTAADIAALTDAVRKITAL